MHEPKERCCSEIGVLMLHKKNDCSAYSAAADGDVRRAMSFCVKLLLASICSLSSASSHHKGHFD